MKELYLYREFLKTSITKEFRGKYKKSFLGVLWSFINPLLQLLVYSVVFSFITRADIENFPVFLVIALIPWTFFSSTLTQSTATIVINGGILKKVYFPRIILPISVTTSNLINFIISCLIVFVALIISGIGLSWYALLVPIVIIVQYFLILGFSFILSAVTVFIRDLEYFINVLMMLWFYITPIVYPAELIPSGFEMLFQLNPMYHFVNIYRDLLYYQQMPNLVYFGIIALFSIAFAIIGLLIFKKLEKKFVEEL